jgi:hypothetical protein
VRLWSARPSAAWRSLLRNIVVSTNVKVTFTQDAFDALVSFTFDLRQRDLRALLGADSHQRREALLSYCHADDRWWTTCCAVATQGPLCCVLSRWRLHDRLQSAVCSRRPITLRKKSWDGVDEYLAFCATEVKTLGSLRRNTESEGPGPFVRLGDHLCASAPNEGESVLLWDPDRFTLFRAAADPAPVILYSFSSATACPHLIHVPSKRTSFSASVSNLILPLRISCHLFRLSHRSC